MATLALGMPFVEPQVKQTRSKAHRRLVSNGVNGPLAVYRGYDSPNDTVASLTAYILPMYICMCSSSRLPLASLDPLPPLPPPPPPYLPAV